MCIVQGLAINDYTCISTAGYVQSIHRGGSQSLCLVGVDTMEFDTFIITQIISVISTFKSTTSNFSMAQIAHLQVLNAWVYDGVLFVLKLINIWKQELPWQYSI